MATIQIRKRGTSVTQTIKCQPSQVGQMKRIYLAAGYGILSTSTK